MWSRRTFFSRLLPGLAGGTAATFATTSASASAVDAAVQKAVYHLSEPDRVHFVLGNIRNHIEGKGGPDKVEIVLVIHGPALRAFSKAKVAPDLAHALDLRRSDGVRFVACGNTMKGLSLAIPDLVNGFEVAEEGGVVRIADLQDAGYRYIRP